MKRYRIIKLNEKINPDFSITHVTSTLFNFFRESDGTDFGNRHRLTLESFGFTKTDLDFVKKNGTTNFIKIENKIDKIREKFNHAEYETKERHPLLK